MQLSPIVVFVVTCLIVISQAGQAFEPLDSLLAEVNKILGPKKGTEPSNFILEMLPKLIRQDPTSGSSTNVTQPEIVNRTVDTPPSESGVKTRVDKVSARTSRQIDLSSLLPVNFQAEKMGETAKNMTSAITSNILNITKSVNPIVESLQKGIGGVLNNLGSMIQGGQKEIKLSDFGF